MNIVKWAVVFITTYFLFGCSNNDNRMQEQSLSGIVQPLPRELPLKVYGNPKDPKVTVLYDCDQRGNALLIIFSSDGKLIARQLVTLQMGKNTLEYRFPPHSSGLFIVQVKKGNKEATAKIFKAVS